MAYLSRKDTEYGTARRLILEIIYNTTKLNLFYTYWCQGQTFQELGPMSQAWYSLLNKLISAIDQ